MKRKAGRKYLTTREEYNSAKKYDREQFDQFCANIYTEGFRNGAKSVPGVEVEDVMNAIRSVKGIGTKRLEEIRTAVEELFKKEKRGESKE